VDLYNRWLEIRANWIEAYRNREVHVGFSVSKKVGPNDEWCAEAYMQTDYSTLDRQHYEENVKRFLVFQLLHGMQPADGVDNEEDVL